MQRHWLVRKFGWPVFDETTVEGESLALVEDVYDRYEKWETDRAEHEARTRRR